MALSWLLVPSLPLLGKELFQTKTLKNCLYERVAVLTLRVFTLEWRWFPFLCLCVLGDFSHIRSPFLLLP